MLICLNSVKKKSCLEIQPFRDLTKGAIEASPRRSWGMQEMRSKKLRESAAKVVEGRVKKRWKEK